MAEVLAIGGVAVSALALATEGLKIADDLKRFVDRFNEAPEEITSLSEDVRITSKTLEELGCSLETAQASQIVNGAWHADTQIHITDCMSTFEDIKGMLSQYRCDEDSLQKATFSTRQKLKLTWNHSKITRSRSKIQHLQTRFVFRLAVFRFSSDAVDRCRKDRERKKAKVVSQLQYERALVDLKIALEQMDDEDIVDKILEDGREQAQIEEGTSRTEHVPNRRDSRSTIAMQSDPKWRTTSTLALPPSPADTTFSPFNKSPSDEQMGAASNSPGIPAQQPTSIALESSDGHAVSKLEGSEADRASLSSSRTSEAQSIAIDTQHKEVSRVSSLSKKSADKVSTALEKQVSVLLNLVQTISERLDAQSPQTGNQGIEGTSTPFERSAVIPTMNEESRKPESNAEELEGSGVPRTQSFSRADSLESVRSSLKYYTTDAEDPDDNLNENKEKLPVDTIDLIQIVEQPAHADIPPIETLPTCTDLVLVDPSKTATDPDNPMYVSSGGVRTSEDIIEVIANDTFVRSPKSLVGGTFGERKDPLPEYLKSLRREDSPTRDSEEHSAVIHVDIGWRVRLVHFLERRLLREDRRIHRWDDPESEEREVRILCIGYRRRLYMFLERKLLWGMQSGTRWSITDSELENTDDESGVDSDRRRGLLRLLQPTFFRRGGEKPTSAGAR